MDVCCIAKAMPGYATEAFTRNRSPSHLHSRRDVPANYFPASLATRNLNTGNCVYADTGAIHAVGERPGALPCPWSTGVRISRAVERREIERDQFAVGNQASSYQQYSGANAQH